ncbi:hypothetical protein ACI2KE_10805 [Pseudomonas monteilii]|jgi:hypothetical protein|uniref:hypothetical protein n=1 Tax=Pseudomonas alabamensis TaxID=3064349 RepID=UPI000745E9F9|nr:hypothetical protein APT63_11310 [Pseudomonas monteilii]
MKLSTKTASLSLLALVLSGCDANTSAHTNAAQLISTFQGDWKVTKVAVSDSGVQALQDDDPSLMGKHASFTPDALTWVPADSAEDACKQPTFRKLTVAPDQDIQGRLDKLGLSRATPYSVRCASGSWGPMGEEDPAFFVGADGSLGLAWYDGGLLKLTRTAR